MAVTDPITLTVLTPEKRLLATKVNQVTLPGTKGRFMVLNNHAPILSSLEEGDVVYRTGMEEFRIPIRTGFVEVNQNHVTICAEV